MRPKDATTRLRRTPPFARCSDRELALIARRLTGHEAAPGDVLVRQGTRGREVFFITAGSSSVTIDGREVARLGPGDIFGEIALLDDRRRTATVSATDDMMVEVGTRTDLAELLTVSPAFRTALLAGLARQARALSSMAGTLHGSGSG